VAKVTSDAELEPAFAEARSFSSSVVIEEWLEGGEYSVNGWIENGQLVSYCVTERITVPGNKPLGVMIAEVYPSGLSREAETAVVDAARRAAAALGHTRGPCYSQVAYGGEGGSGAYLFETAARLGGGFDADVTYLASGVDLYKRVLGVAVGDSALESSGVERERAGGAIAKFLIAKPGDVKSIAGLDEARAMAEDAQVFVKDKVHPLTDSAKRAGYVLAQGKSREDAERRADQALARIRIET
jgi:biotin carboxylase